MIFESLWESARNGELILIDGGMCRYHLRRDGQLTIREIISTRRGAGSEMLARLKAIPGARSILGRCPEHIPANCWYRRRGFQIEGSEATRAGRVVNIWRLSLCPEST